MHVRFDRGTLVLEPQHPGEDPSQIPGAAYDPEQRAWRVRADHHASLLVRLSATSVRPPDKPGQTRTRRLSGTWSLPELRWYQREAIAAWRAAGDRGVIALPTGAGKTVTALAALAALGVPALVLVPTRVLLDQWCAALAAAWPHAIGKLGDGEHDVRSLTVSTYASAITWMPRIGDQFGAVVVDEAHHVGAYCPVEVLEMLTAAARLGLTATPPDDPAAIARLAEHIGPVVYTRTVAELDIEIDLGAATGLLRVASPALLPPLVHARMSPSPADRLARLLAAKRFASTGITVERDPRPIEHAGALLHPDFAITVPAAADAGTRVGTGERRWLVEVLGFATADYLAAKLARYRAAGVADVVIYVERKRLPPGELDPRVVAYDGKLVAEPLLAAIGAGEDAVRAP